MSKQYFLDLPIDTLPPVAGKQMEQKNAVLNVWLISVFFINLRSIG